MADSERNAPSTHSDPKQAAVKEEGSVLICALVIVAATVAAYFNSFSGVFLFDDRLQILDEEKRIETLWPPWEMLTRRRPVVDFTLELNHRVGGDSVWTYHAVNLAVHILAALTLFGIIRRTLLIVQRGSDRELRSIPSSLSKRSSRSRTWLATPSAVALAVAVLWGVHPLTTQSVTYLIQRAESMMGLFYLLTLYAALRCATSTRPKTWGVICVFSCMLGMGSKAVMVTAPLTVLLFDRMFLAKSWVSILRKRKWLYVGLAATWSVLWITGTAPAVLNSATKNSNVGFSYKGIAPWEYAQTQCGVLITYLRLVFWPHPLCLDYAWPRSDYFGGWVMPGLLIVALLVLVARGVVQRRSVAFLGACFFLVLAPTSSFIPIRDTMFEHRMYLPLAGVLCLVVLMLRDLLNRLATRTQWSPTTVGRMGSTIMAAFCLLAGGATWQRNNMYHGESNMWFDVLQKQPQSVRAIENYGTALLAEERTDEALPVLQEATQRNPGSAEAQNALGFALASFGRFDEAKVAFEAALRANPKHRRALTNLGHIFHDTGHIDQCIAFLTRVVQDHPRYLDARIDLGNAFLTSGQPDKAIAQYRAVLDIDNANLSAMRNLGTALLNVGHPKDALALFLRAAELEPEFAGTFDKLGIAYASLDRMTEATTAFRRALTLEPDNAKFHGDFAKCLLIAGDAKQAERQYRRGIELDPKDPNLHYELGVALKKLGRTEEARAAFRRTLDINPNDANAKKALDTTPAEHADRPNN